MSDSHNTQAALLSPRISEKTTNATQKLRQYVFNVPKKSNKHQVKDIVEKSYSVKVEQVRILKVRGAKKAYVKLQKGHEINLISSSS